MTEIIPAVIPKSFAELKEKVAIVAGHVPTLHIDVEDSTLTKYSSWPYLNGNGDWERIQNQESGLPHWEELNFEAHLMVKNPEERYEEWVRAGAERLVIHLESFETSEAASEFLNKLQKYFSLRDSDFGIEVGLGVNFKTPIEEVLPHVLECDYVHLMSIDEDGRQGDKFDEGIFAKIKELRTAYPETIIAIDGGVNGENAEKLVEAGADRLIVGSAIFAAEEPLEALEDLLLI